MDLSVNRSALKPYNNDISSLKLNTSKIDDAKTENLWNSNNNLSSLPGQSEHRYTIYLGKDGVVHFGNNDEHLDYTIPVNLQPVDEDKKNKPLPVFNISPVVDEHFYTTIPVNPNPVSELITPLMPGNENWFYAGGPGGPVEDKNYKYVFIGGGNKKNPKKNPEDDNPLRYPMQWVTINDPLRSIDDKNKDDDLNIGKSPIINYAH